jgi:hypothetical protein
MIEVSDAGIPAFAVFAGGTDVPIVRVVAAQSAA